MPETKARRARVLIAKPGLDGHDRGAKVIARALRDAGMEVIYTGLRQSPEQIVAGAAQEDAEVIGLSILSGAHLPICRRVARAPARAGDGVRPRVRRRDHPGAGHSRAEADGVHDVFLPGARTEDVIRAIEGVASTAA